MALARLTAWIAVGLASVTWEVSAAMPRKPKRHWRRREMKSVRMSVTASIYFTVNVASGDDAHRLAKAWAVAHEGEDYQIDLGGGCPPMGRLYIEDFKPNIESVENLPEDS